MGAGVIALGAVLVLGETKVTASATLFLSLAYQTVILSTASYLAWFALMRVYLAYRLGVLSLMTPVFGIAFGIVILGDNLTFGFLTGTALILFGILLVSGRDLLVRRTIRPPLAASTSRRRTPSASTRPS